MGVLVHNLYHLLHTPKINNLKEQKSKQEEPFLPPFSPSYSHNLPLVSNRQQFGLNWTESWLNSVMV